MHVQGWHARRATVHRMGLQHGRARGRGRKAGLEAMEGGRGGRRHSGLCLSILRLLLGAVALKFACYVGVCMLLEGVAS